MRPAAKDGAVTAVEPDRRDRKPQSGQPNAPSHRVSRVSKSVATTAGPIRTTHAANNPGRDRNSNRNRNSPKPTKAETRQHKHRVASRPIRLTSRIAEPGAAQALRSGKSRNLAAEFRKLINGRRSSTAARIFLSPMNILVIVAHPDDPEFFCGGTIAKLVKRGPRCELCDCDWR